MPTYRIPRRTLTQKILTTMLGVLFAVPDASAERLSSKPRSCPKDSPCAATARTDTYQDDCNPMQHYDIKYKCDCTVSVEFWTVRPPSHWFTPPEWDALEASADFETPGALNGMYYIDSMGKRYPLRNPYSGEVAALNGGLGPVPGPTMN